MSKSLEDLFAAFAGESQANRRYLAFAQRADEEGYAQAAKLFRAAAEAETVHAINHFKAAGEVKTTTENLQTAIKGENYEVSTMYPEFVGDAETDQNRKALTSFRYALEVEKVHENLYTKALATLSKDTPQVDYYVCPVCGNTFEGIGPDRCPVCNAPSSRFKKIE
jgi:rubrerythrin